MTSVKDIKTAEQATKEVIEGSDADKDWYANTMNSILFRYVIKERNDLRAYAEQLERERDALREQAKENAKAAAMTNHALAGQVNDLAALVRRFIHASKSGVPITFADKAVDYLKRNNLQGSPLRMEDVLRGSPQPVGAVVVEQVEQSPYEEITLANLRAGKLSAARIYVGYCEVSEQLKAANGTIKRYSDELTSARAALAAQAPKNIGSVVEALQKIAKTETEVFDEDEGCNVIVFMDAEEMVEIARAALAAQTPAPLIGWKIVPVEATNEIICAIEAMVDQQLIASGSSPADMVRQDGSDIWDAAIAAAPSPEAQGDKQGDANGN